MTPFDIIANLLKVKSIITLVLLGLVVYAVVNGIIQGQYLETIFTTVIGFYFGTQYQKAVQQNEKVEEKNGELEAYEAKDE